MSEPSTRWAEDPQAAVLRSIAKSVQGVFPQNADAIRGVAAHLERQAEGLAKVWALADEWEATAAGTARAAAAREGLSDAHQLSDHSDTCRRHAARLRTALNPTSTGADQ